MPKPIPEPVDSFTPMGIEDLEREHDLLLEKLKETKIRRNFVQQERVR